MSNQVRNESILDILAVINTLLALVATSVKAAQELADALAKPRSEGRELTDDEIAALRQKALDERDRLIG